MLLIKGLQLSVSDSSQFIFSGCNEVNVLAFSGKWSAFKVPLTTKPVGIYFHGCIYWNIMQKQHTWAAPHRCGGRGGDTCDSAGRNRLLVDPEGDLGQHHNHDERDVGLDEVVAELPLQVEVDHLHRVVTCRTNSMCEESKPPETRKGGTQQTTLYALEAELIMRDCVFVSCVSHVIGFELHSSMWQRSGWMREKVKKSVWRGGRHLEMGSSGKEAEGRGLEESMQCHYG